MTGRRKTHRVQLRGVVLLTAPLLLAALYVVGGALFDYHRATRYRDWWSRYATVEHFARHRLRAALSTPRALALDHALAADADRPDSIDLLVNRREWDDLQGGATPRWGVAIDGQVARGHRLHPVDVRLRGDTSVHWTTEKKTVQLRTSRRELLFGSRDLVLSVKAPLPMYIVNHLARDGGLLSPDSDVVPVFLNRRFHGLAHAYAPIDEGLLRRSGRLPGNIFRGDTRGGGEEYLGVPQSLFHNPEIWDRVAEVGPDSDDATLRGWLRDLNGTTREEHERFMARMDRAELARMLALILVAGDTLHIDDRHNHYWYEDPSSGILHPIVWDVGLHDLQRPPDQPLSVLWQAVLRDPRVLDGAARQIHAWLEDDALLRRARARAEAVWQRHESAFRFDLLRSDVVSVVGHPEGVVALLRRNLDFLAARIEDARVALAAHRDAPGEWTVDLQNRGWVGVELTGVAVDGAPPDGVELFADVNRNGVLDRGDAAWPLGAGAERAALPILPGARADTRVTAEPLHYRWFARTAPTAQTLQLELRNAVTGGPVTVTQWPVDTPIPAARSWHPWDGQPAAAPRRVRWSGDVRLDRDVAIPAGSTLQIDPGTTVTLAAEVSVVVRGQLHAVGTAERRIEFRGAVAGRPWGTLALHGAAASGSRAEHVVFRDGGGATRDRVTYQGMVAVHHARDVRFAACEFAHNRRCDDALNAVHAEVEVLGCRFHDINADAIDFDLSTGAIRDCAFERCGNDGIDLMTSAPLVLDNRITGAEDKGISIGEDAAPVVLGNAITGCAIGIEVKDRSRPLLAHNDVQGNRLGVAARRKNWRYARGGWPSLVRSRVTGNDRDLEVDGDSRITVLESAIGDAAPAAPPGGDLSWLLAPAGLAVDGAAAGRPPSWSRRPPRGIALQRSFRDDLARPVDDWTTSGAVRWAERTDRGLAVRVAAGTGQLVLPIATAGEAATVTVILELTATGLRSVRCGPQPHDDAAPAVTLCALPPAARHYGYATIELSRPRHRGVVLELESERPGGLLVVGSLRVLDSGKN